MRPVEAPGIMEAELDDELVFEIAYVEEEKGRVSLRNIETCLSSLESIRRKPLEQGRVLYQYYNSETEASCDFLVTAGGNARPPALTCELTLPRPTFFALECLPLAVRVARE